MSIDILKRRVTIASIWPEKMAERRPYAAAPYVLEAGSVDKPSILVVEDAMGSDYAPMSATFGAAESIPRPVLASKIAADLIRCWTLNRGNCVPDEMPGIWVCEGDAPTVEEIAEADRKQRPYMSRQVEQGDVYFRDNNLTYITTTMRVCAKALGMADRLWIREIKADNFTHCPACREQILEGAVVCKHCNTFIPEFTEKIKKFTPQAASAPMPPPMKPIPGQPHTAA